MGSIKDWDMNNRPADILTFTGKNVAYELERTGKVSARKGIYECRIMEETNREWDTTRTSIDQLLIDPATGAIDSNRRHCNYTFDRLAGEEWMRMAAVRAFVILSMYERPMDERVHPQQTLFEEIFQEVTHEEMLKATPTNIQTGGPIPQATLQYAQECLAKIGGNNPGDDTREVEPPCHCKKPWNFGHDAGCPWKKWKDERV